MAISKTVKWFARGSLMALAIYLGSSYVIKSLTSPAAGTPAADGHLFRANERRFRSLLKDGEKALASGQYKAAADSFVEAERSADRLTDEQYEALKKSRLQLAESYQKAGAEPEVEGVYRAMVDSALRDGDPLLRAKQYDSALKRGQDAEEFCSRLPDPSQCRSGAASLQVSSLQVLQRYGEAAEKEQQLIDDLKSSGHADDKDFAQHYSTLAMIDSDAKDWSGAEAAYQMEIDACDRALAHFEQGKQPPADLTVVRNWGQFNLVIAYYQADEVSTALSKAGEFYKEYSERPTDPWHPWNVAHGANDFAALALEIARETNRQDDIDLWQRRAPGGIKVVALRPLDKP